MTLEREFICRKLKTGRVGRGRTVMSHMSVTGLGERGEES